MKNIMSFFKDLTASLNAKQKKTLYVLLVLMAFMVVASLAYYYTRGNNAQVSDTRKSTAKKTELAIDRHLFEKSAYLESRKKIDELTQENQDLKKTLDEMKRKEGLPALTTGSATPSKYSQGKVDKELLPPAPPVPPVPPVPTSLTGQPVAFPPPPSLDELKKKEEQGESPSEYVGNIAVQSNKVDTAADKKDDVKKKKTIYLPPSFMAATLLSGLDAPAASNAKGQPLPVLIKIDDPAFLPNKVRADLSGCFVIAEGYGNLADERAHLRATNISCLSKRGESIIDAPIKGFLVDSDGKIGIRGTVASKMGAVLARSAMAGFLSGLGDALRQQTQTVAISPLGSTQTIESDKIIQAGFGTGLSSALQEISKFYLELARQTLPVIQIGALRSMTLVISEGTELEIKEARLPKRENTVKIGG